MHFHDADLLRLIGRVPYMRLAKPATAARYIEKLAADASELESVLIRYPAVLYEPLDDHYVLMRALGVLNESLVSDLTVHYTWRGIVWAAWLAALAPSAAYRTALLAARSRAPHNQWLVDLALSEIDGNERIGDAALRRDIRRLRKALQLVPWPQTALRVAPTGAELDLMKLEREQVKMGYFAGGCSGARKELARCPTLCAFL